MGRSSKFTVSVLAGVLFTGVAAFAVVGWLITRSLAGECVHDDHILGPNSEGDTVLVREEVCDGIAHSDIATLTLKPKQGASMAFFSYAPSYVPNVAEPKAFWASPRNLTINLAKADEIYLKRERVRNVTIRYKIGRVELTNDRH